MIGALEVCTEQDFADDSGVLEDPEELKRAMDLELKRMEELSVFERVPWENAEGKLVKSRWVKAVKLDAQGHRFVRARLVAKEIKTSERMDTYAATPPLSTVRLIVSLAASKSRRRSVARHDVSVAFFHANMTEKVAVIPPPGVDNANVV